MTSLPTMPRRTWLERVSLTLAGVLVVIGVVTVAGWWLQVDELTQPFADIPATKINSAICIGLLGLALIALEFNRRAAAWLALAPAAIGALTLVEFAFELNLHIDELLAHDRLVTVFGEHPGRMAITPAACYFIAGTVLFWYVVNRAARVHASATAVVGSIIGAAGFSTLLGYAVKLDGVYKWGTNIATPQITAIALAVLGLALVTSAWRDGRKLEGESPWWAPLPAIFACFTLTMVLAVGLHTRERAYVVEKTVGATDSLSVAINSELKDLANEFERLAGKRSQLDESKAAAWQAQAEEIFESRRPHGCVAIAYVDANGRNQWFVPAAGNEGAPNFNHNSVLERRDALTLASRQENPVISAALNIPVPGKQPGVQKGVAIYAPVLRGDRTVGFVAGDFVFKPLFDQIISGSSLKLSSEYHVSIALAGSAEPIYMRAAKDSTRNDDLKASKTYTIEDRKLTITLTPSNAALKEERHYLPELALGAGLGITLLLGLSVHLSRTARAGQRAAELSNKKLQAENEERRRVEARLKVSDERLRLALDSTQIGIFEWSVAAGHVYYSPGLWAMLGYDHVRMPSTVEAWQSLIHPDDLALYRRRVESQLNGIASFIEPEYRVRARNGDWRWVYTRSKSVATNPDGRPTRIIGTVQDITARREAEIALRESQAEARKLSLVAAKTDNPVLIGSPDGRIEWANEAFCRVMEYSLEEVVGKNPAHFMIGPETNPRTVARIRAAMARGHGISTDVVNYSKSGRKYHLHLEVQPVHGASGELENFIAVQTDITARVETEQQLRRAKAEADEASRAKSEFLASMSHEIRTPMNGVIGMTSLLMETTLTAEQRDFVNTIRTSGEALLTIINDILDFSKIESGKMELERAPFELALCIEEALDLFALQSSAKKLEIGYMIAPEVPSWIMGDVTRLRQVIVNLVNNAVKFTPSGSISVEVRRAAREPTLLGFDPGPLFDSERTILEFAVHDTGIGIPADRLDRLFKAFSQVDSSTTRKYGGTGLGLAICQRLCELMGGRIRVESRQGEGSVFIFTIQTEAAPGGSDSGLPSLPTPVREGTVLCVEDHPVTQARLRTLFTKWGAQCVIARDTAEALEVASRMSRPPSMLVVDEDEIETLSPLDALASIRCPRLALYPFGQTVPIAPDDGLPFGAVSKPIRTGAFQHAIVTLFNPSLAAAGAAKPVDRTIGEEIPLEVLLAEDNVVNQKVALRFLERLGYRAEAVANGLEALTALENRRYDLVLMDVQMPEMDGYQATRQIRARLPAERQPKIIALTANALQGDREQAEAAGMDDYISKPVKMHEIAAAIRRHFGPRPARAASERLIG